MNCKTEDDTMIQYEVKTVILQTLQEYMKCEFFEEDISRIWPLCTIHQYKKGATVVEVNTPTTEIGFILHGMIRAYYIDAEGREITKNFLRERGTFLTDVLFGLKTSYCIYEALSDTTVIYMKSEKLREIIEETPKLKAVYVRWLEGCYRYKLERERSLMMLSPTECYLQFQKRYPDLEKQMKVSHIATYIGIAPESLSRIRKDLKDS